MRKNVNKIVAFAIGISIISGSIVPAFASDNVESTNNTTANVQIQVNGRVLLTLDDAIKAAISNSNILALDEKKISYQDKVNDINEKIDDAKDADSDHQDYDEDINDNTLGQLKQQRDFDEDKLVQKTTNAYNNIVTSQMKIDKASKILELKKKDISNAKLKKDLGIMTSIDFDSTELQIQSLQNQQNLSINTLRDAQDSFKALTGKDVTKFTLEQDIKYEQLKIDGSIDEYLDNAIDKYLKYSSELLKLKKDYYDDKDNQVSEEDVKKAEDITNEAITKKPSKPTNTDDLGAYMKYVDDMNQYNTNISAYTTTLSLRLAYLNSKLGVYTQETALEETKKTYKESLKTIYTNLLATEDNINYLKSSIQINNRQLSTLKLKSDLGLMTKSDYDTQVANSQDLDIQLRTAIDSYNTLKEKIQKPWLAF
ncbi:TolC family protein [Clostridium chromiireducens]|uniref:TolC family protein n=1 Tax=Clostridium chromiireducens TaxID=225345 RepID=UPI003AF94051